MNKYNNKLNFIIFSLSMFCFHIQSAFAFTKLKNGIESITQSYLIPLAGAVAGASFIYYVTMSFLKQEEGQKKAANVFITSVFIGAGSEIINTVIQNFS
jgi:hypothetical protein